MKLSYKGFELDARREESLGGDILTYYSIFRESDQLEVTSGFEYGRVRDTMRWMKLRVDRIVSGEEPIDDDDDPDVLGGVFETQDR